MLTPHLTFQLLLFTQLLHLLHHRLAKRHISFAEVISAGILCVPLDGPIQPTLLMGGHISLIVVQVVGSLWIRKLSPDWQRPHE